MLTVSPKTQCLVDCNGSLNNSDFKATGLGLGYPLLYGQNLHKGAEENQSWKGVLEKWYDERHNFAYGEYSPGAKHYIQVIAIRNSTIIIVLHCDGS